MTPIYLDANATTRPFPEVVETIARHLHESWGNPGSRHVFGRQARRVLEDCRESIAAILGASPDEVVFTSGGTESNNMALLGLARGRSGTIALPPGEHPATVEACRTLQQRGWELCTIPVDNRGQLDLTQGFMCNLFTCLLAHNETGVLQNSEPISDLCRKHGIPFHVDAVQAVGKIPVDFHALSATTLSFGAHKFHGPRGIGGLLIRRGTTLSPLLFGGHQESNRRPGTEPVALIAGMAKALELWSGSQSERAGKLQALRDRLQSGLQQKCAPTIVHAATAPRLPNTLSIAFPGLDGEALLVALDLVGICCSLGSTCASGSMEPTSILLAMGCPPEIAKATVRFSVSIDNTPDELDEAVERISSVVARLRRTGVTD